MGAPQARLYECAIRLQKLGWDVEVLTALPNYPHGKIHSGYDPRAAVVEEIGGIRTVRVPLTPAKRGFAKRLYCYFSFVFAAQRLGPRMCQVPDLLWVESPPLFIGYAARSLARRWRCPFVLNVSDLWPESAIRMGVVKRGIATWLAERLELSLYRDAAGVTGQSTEIVDWIKQLSPPTRTKVITNGVDIGRFGKDKLDQTARELLGEQPGPIFVYAGLLGMAQGLGQILDLAQSLPDDAPGRFVLMGDGPEREQLVRRVQEEAISRVKVLPSQPREQVPGILAAADCAIIPLKTRLPGAVPSKIYEAMASGLPILLIAEGEPVRRVDDAQCGLSVMPSDLEAFRNAYLRIAGDPELRRRLGDAGRRAAEATYNREGIAEILDEFLRDQLTSSSGVVAESKG